MRWMNRLPIRIWDCFVTTSCSFKMDRKHGKDTEFKWKTKPNSIQFQVVRYFFLSFCLRHSFSFPLNVPYSMCWWIFFCFWNLLWTYMCFFAGVFFPYYSEIEFVSFYSVELYFIFASGWVFYSLRYSIIRNFYAQFWCGEKCKDNNVNSPSSDFSWLKMCTRDPPPSLIHAGISCECAGFFFFSFLFILHWIECLRQPMKLNREKMEHMNIRIRTKNINNDILKKKHTHIYTKVDNATFLYDILQYFYTISS